MSDIITAIKGQAANVNTDEESVFTIEEMIKRCALLMRHEFLRGGCQMEVRYDLSRDIALKGDINNLIQVLTNLLSNAVYAQHEAGGGKIVVQIGYDKENLNISVKDHGSGISPAVRGRLFKSMVTNKGALGTGLGLYISNAVIRGKFGGTMWFEDNEAEVPYSGFRFHFPWRSSGKRQNIARGTINEKEQTDSRERNIHTDIG